MYTYMMCFMLFLYSMLFVASRDNKILFHIHTCIYEYM